VPIVNFHRMPFVLLSVVVLVIAGSLTYFYVIYREPLGPEYRWGDADTLALNITLERTSVSANDSLNFTAVLKNTGTEKVRIYPWDWESYFHLRVSNGSASSAEEYQSGYLSHNYTVPWPSESEYNRMLVVLEPNGTYKHLGSVQYDGRWDDGWPLRPGFNCSLLVIYSYRSYRAPPALPVWTGTIESNWQNFTTLP
jgi:hypothetical protein